MTTMPPEMSTATTSTPMPVPLTKNKHSLLIQQSSRSRFMITDILAGSAAAAAAALRTENKAESTTKLINNSKQSSKNIKKYGDPHQSHENQTTLQQYSIQQSGHFFQRQQQSFFIGSPSYPQQLAFSSHADQMLTSERNQGQTELSMPSCDFASNVNTLNNMMQTTRYKPLQRIHQNVNVMNTEAPFDKVGQGAVYSGIYRDDRSRSPLPSSQIESQDFSVKNDHGKMIGGSGVSGGSISGDQASTIDESDSDTCGGREEDEYSSKSNALMGLSKKQRKARTAFTDHQLQTLEKSFERQKYLSVQDRMELANKLELSDCQVKTWYQNRRTKWKRQTAVGLELLAEAGNYAAFQRLYGNSPYLSTWPYAVQPPHTSPANAIDMYFRQAAAAAVLQKPISYRMYPGVPHLSDLTSVPMPPSSFTHLNASNPLSTLSSYYQTSVQHPPKNTDISLPYVSNQQFNSELDISRRSVEVSNVATSSQFNSGNVAEHMGKEENAYKLVEDDNDIDDDDIEV